MLFKLKLKSNAKRQREYVVILRSDDVRLSCQNDCQYQQKKLRGVFILYYTVV